MNRIQVAGALDERELQLFFDLGVDDIGFPVGPGVRTPDMPDGQANTLCQKFRKGHSSVAIVYLNRCATLLDFFTRYPHFEKIQLHENIELGELREFRKKMPDRYVIKSLVIGEKPFSELLGEANTFAPHVDAFLTDTFDANTGARGATGLAHDWNLSRQIREAISTPLILAGGLNAQNVARAIETVEPFAVDVHSGVEGLDGRKDRTKLLRFVTEARRAFSLIA